MIHSPEIQAKINIWRRKAAEGLLTPEEQAEAVLILRSGRMSASAASDKSRKTKAVKTILSADALLDEMDDL